MSDWWESIESDYAARGSDEPEWEDDGEDPDDPSTWDLMADRATDYVANPLAGFGALGIRELLNIVLDWVMPDGSVASDEVRGYALDVALKSRSKRGRNLWVAVLVAHGEDENGMRVIDHEEQMRAWDEIDKARLDSRGMAKDASGEYVLATGPGKGDYRDERGRGIVRTRSSDQKIKSVDKTRRLIEQECVKQGLTLEQAVIPFAPGRQSKPEQTRRAKVALVVAGVRARGVTQQAIGRVLGAPQQRIADLEKIGVALRETIAG